MNGTNPLPYQPVQPISTSLPVTSPAMVQIKDKRKNLFIILGAVVALILILALISFFFKLGPRKVSLSQKIVLTYWGLFEPETVFQPIIAEYEKDHPRVKIQYLQSSLKEYRQRLQTALEGKEGPDIFRLHQSWIPMFGNYLSLVPSSVYDASTFEKTFYPSAKETLKYQGQYVAIPLEFDGLALFYNEDLFRAAGKTPPQNWDEVRKVALEMTVRDQQGKILTAGIALGATNVDHWSDILGLMLLQSGVDPSNPGVCSEEAGVGGKVCPGADALSYFTLFTRVDRVWDATLPSSTFSFATGKLAMYFGPSWRVFDIENFKKEYKSAVNYKIIPVPQLQGGNVTWASFWVEAVSKNSLHTKEAWEFLQYLSSKDGLQKLYQLESNLRGFGEPYPRVEMAETLKAHPLVGAYLEQAPFAKNWYLSSNTFDNGLNDEMIKYYEDAVNAVNNGQDSLTALNTASQGIIQVLRKYSIFK